MFSDSDKATLAKHIATLEQSTSAELVVAVVPRSNDYEGERAWVAMLSSLLVVTAAHWVWPALGLAANLALLLVIFGLLYRLLNADVLLRGLMFTPDAEHEVFKAAHAAFSQHRVYGTAGRNGVLVFISELEHRVVILADKAAYEVLGEAGLQAQVASVVSALRGPTPLAGLLLALDALAKSLSGAFPGGSSRANQLPDVV